MKTRGICANSDVDKVSDRFLPSALADIARGAVGEVRAGVGGPVIGTETKRTLVDSGVEVEIDLDPEFEGPLRAGKLYAFVSGEIVERGDDPRRGAEPGARVEGVAEIAHVRNVTIGITLYATGTHGPLVAVDE